MGLQREEIESILY